MTTGPAPYYQDGSVHLFHGDCLEVLPELPADSVDAVCTDPPYSISFMSRSWDQHASPVEFQAWCQTWAAECLRILKPGGFLLAFGGTRTSHRLACAVEDAGFEIRDSIAWLYGSGFPKSLDVSKAIDRRRDWTLVERLAGEIRRARVAAGLSLAEIGQATMAATGDTYGRWYHRGGHMFFETGRSLPSRPEWEQLRHVLPIAPEFAEVYDAAEREVIGKAQWDNSANHFVPGEDHTQRVRLDVTAPGTPEAEQWQGWGTALKPAHEPIIVARKPLSGNVAANVLRWGTGALNIDAGRIGTAEDRSRPPGRTAEAVVFSASHNGSTMHLRANPSESHPAGRWPANVALDESQAAALDQQSGELTSGGYPPEGGQRSHVATYGAPNERGEARFGGSTGGASRFYFTAKASSDERITHNEPMCVCGHSRSQHADDEWGSCLIPGCWCPGFAIDRSTVKRTAHPTVKPLSLMRWLVRLVTPPGGLILEPFAGSGTTVEAALLEGFRCIAIEREADYLPLITQRINRRRDPIAYLAAAGEDLGLFGLDDDEPEAPAQPQGRWPANVVLDRSQAEALDQMSGDQRDGVATNRNRDNEQLASDAGWGYRKQSEDVGYGQSGGASRFFKVVDDDFGDGGVA